MKKILLFTLVIVILVVSASSCFRPMYNVEGVNKIVVPPVVEYDDPEALVFVSLSGGGTRAAAMSWKALSEFKKIPYVFKNKSGKEIHSNLADQIDYISGISGGSFAAAAWCLYRDNMKLFRKKFIERNVESALLKRLFWPPTNGIRLVSRYYDRINVASEFYDEEVFGKKTFGDLTGRPVLWINATHLALGNRFTYTKEYFDFLGSDLSKYPIGYACAASSAFPILLSPMTLKNYGAEKDLNKDIKYKVSKMNAFKDVEADFYCRERNFYNDKRNKFMHFADGGLFDNQGLQVVIDQLISNGGVINKKLNDYKNPLKRLIIINVNAGVASNDKSCRKEAAPGVPSVVEYTMVTSMDVLSAKRWMQLKRECEALNKAIIDDKKETKSLSLLEKPYTIEINFRNLDDEDREKCDKLPTSFKLTKEQLALIDRVVPKLVKNNPDLKRLQEFSK